MSTDVLETEAGTERERWSSEDALRRYPCLTAHLISCSLGYFSPLAAANAIAHHKNGEAFWCEWYCDWAAKLRANRPEEHGQEEPRNTLRKVGAMALLKAFRYRSTHTGYMAEYRQARALVEAERKEAGVTTGMLASWF